MAVADAKAASGPQIRPAGAATYMRALRPHQWLKNLLVLAPAAAAHNLDGPLIKALIAFVSFSLCASAVYVINDLRDLDADRAHPRKRNRPFASDAIPTRHGWFMAPVFLAGALGLGLLLSAEFLLVLGAYFALTLAYSFALKRRPVVDVIVLAALYGARLIAGSAASGVPLSPWLEAEAMFLFLCLAIVKRVTELFERAEAGLTDVPGRGYRAADLPVMQSMAAASGYVAVLVLALYLNSPAVLGLYGHPHRLWLICVIMLFWVSRVLLKTARGEMHDDPVVFAVKDRVSLICAALAAAAVGVAIL